MEYKIMKVMDISRKLNIPRQTVSRFKYYT